MKYSNGHRPNSAYTELEFPVPTILAVPLVILAVGVLAPQLLLCLLQPVLQVLLLNLEHLLQILLLNFEHLHASKCHVGHLLHLLLIQAHVLLHHELGTSMEEAFAAILVSFTTQLLDVGLVDHLDCDGLQLFLQVCHQEHLSNFQDIAEFGTVLG